MGYQLWYSPQTGIRRKGTTLKELQVLFIDHITTKYICEPLQSCRVEDNSLHVKDTLIQSEFDVAGVINENDLVIGYIVTKELATGNIGQYLREISGAMLISDTTPICRLFTILSEDGYMFVTSDGKVDSIVTVADINKPIVRIYIFGIISLFELHLNFWINTMYKDETWRHILKDKRINAAEKTFAERQGENAGLSLLECLQLSDKKEILVGTERFRKTFNYSKSKLKSFLRHSERIRNDIAHNQHLIIKSLEWKTFVTTLVDIESFLTNSENEVESMIKEIRATSNSEQEDLHIQMFS